VQKCCRTTKFYITTKSRGVKHIRYRTYATSYSVTRECEFLYSRAKSHCFSSTPEFLASARTRERPYSRVLKLLLPSIKAATRELSLACLALRKSALSFEIVALTLQSGLFQQSTFFPRLPATTRRWPRDL